MRPTLIALVLAACTSAGATALPVCPAETTEFITSDSGVVLFIPRDLKGSTSVGPFGSVLKAVQDRLAAQGTTLVMLIPPIKGMTYTPAEANVTAGTISAAKSIYVSYLDSLRTRGITVIDLSDLSGFKSEMNRFFLNGDHHWSLEGSRYAAQVTAATLKLPPGDPVAFVTTKGSIGQVQGGLQDLLEKRCGFKTTRDQWEKVQNYITNDPGGNLLGDEVNDVVVVGDSFVAGPWNFTGFLEQALQRRVLNASVSGGGIFTSMLRYLQNPPPQAPKVIVWEIYKGNLDGELGMGTKERLQLPANSRLLLGTFDTCGRPVVEKSIPEARGGFAVPLKRQGNVLKLVFASSSVGEFTVTLNGSGTPVPMLVSRGYKTEVDKTFQLELTPEDLVGLTGVTITGNTLNGAVSVSQCE